MKAFLFNGALYLRAIPAKTLFHSTMVHEVVNRGDVFALELSTGKLTVIPGLAAVQHLDIKIEVAPANPTITVAAMKKRIRKPAPPSQVQQGSLL